MPLSLFSVKGLNCMECGVQGRPGYEYGGQYKTDDNVILEVDAVGQQRVRFRPTPAEETPQAMEQLELAYMAARSDSNINQLLLIPCVRHPTLPFNHCVFQVRFSSDNEKGTCQVYPI